MIIEGIKKAVAELPPDQFAQFRAWFDEFYANKGRLDEKIEQERLLDLMGKVEWDASGDYKDKWTRD